MIGYVILTTGIALVVLSPLLRVLERLTEGIYYMADLEAGAIADLSAAVDSAVALIINLAADLKAAGSPVDHSADIEALKQKLAAAVSAASAPAPTAAPAPTPPHA